MYINNVNNDKKLLKVSLQLYTCSMGTIDN